MVLRPRRCARASMSTPFSRARRRVEGLAIMSVMRAPSPTCRNVLGFHEFQHAFVPAFTAKARLLGAAERGGRVRDEAAVQADHSVIQPFADLHRALEIF